MSGRGRERVLVYNCCYQTGTYFILHTQLYCLRPSVMRLLMENRNRIYRCECISSNCLTTDSHQGLFFIESSEFSPYHSYKLTQVETCLHWIPIFAFNRHSALLKVPYQYLPWPVYTLYLSSVFFICETETLPID